MIKIGERWGLPAYPVSFVVERGAERHHITIVPNRLDPPQALDIVLGSVQLFVIVVVLAIGSLLVLLRPTRATWAWFILSLWTAGSWLGDLNGTTTLGYSFLPPLLHLAITELFTVLEAAGVVAILIFAIYFPDRQPYGLARVMVRWAPFMFAMLVTILLTWDALVVICYCAPFWLGRSITILNTAIPAVGVSIAVSAFWKSRGIERQKVQWIAAALVLAFVPYVIPYIEKVVMHGWHIWLDKLDFANQFLELLYIALPLAVAYTIIRHRVYDVKFIIGRAIVLTILTSVVVVIFALIDWVFIRKLEQAGLGVIVGMVSVTLIGFTAHAMHRKVDMLVDKMFFRRRHLAEMQIVQLARELPSAGSPEALDAMLVKEPLNALQLASAALFRRGDGDHFVREDAIGWPSDALRALDVETPPLSHMVDLRETQRIRWRDPGNHEFPSPDCRPVLAMPIIVRNRLQAVVVYGPHEDGADFDPDEIKAINGLAVPAAAAYDHLEADQLRREAETMRREAESLRDQQQRADDEPEPTPPSSPQIPAETE